ncbi:hypothetical protein QYM36_005065 [Artemia franciscana]|uniref:Uncharacterized protein n=1 Tax=Artemia franciscana TaxID=6661 RepID=A0AA88LFB7_ARTSF|nr:hypothetical protein QYM36_005065 [Artemia franciscana]
MLDLLKKCDEASISMPTSGLEGIHSSLESSRGSAIRKQLILKTHKIHFATPCSEKTLHVKFHSVLSSISSDGHFHTVYDNGPSETAVEAPTDGFQHKHLMAGMFITVAYELKGKRGSICEKVYVGMIDTLCPYSVEVIFVRKAGASLCCFKFHTNNRDKIELSKVVQILPCPVIDGKSFSYKFPCQITSDA